MKTDDSDSVQLGLWRRASSLDHILQTNDPPSDHEIYEIRHLLRDIEQYIGAHDNHPKDSEAYQFEDLGNACRSALSTLRRLPTEIMSEIFFQALPLDRGDWNTLDITNEPWTLAYVSSSWRAIALAHQELWSFIRTDLGILDQAGKPEPAIAMLLCVLQRSGDHPLSIDFTDNVPTSRTKELLLALLPNSHRWLDVKFSISFQDLEVLSPVREHLPLLRSLEVYAYGNSTSGVLHAFEKAPCLREASLSVGDPHILPLPWSQLLTFRGSLVPSLAVLHDLSQVVDCSLTFGMWYSMSLPDPVIQHHTMRRLQIDSEYALDGLKAPHLEVLHISVHQIWSQLHYIASFLQRSCCSLQSLLLTNVTINDRRDLVLLLEAAPSLVFFQVRYGVVVWDMLLRLLIVTRSQCLLPDLRTLRLVFGKKSGLSNTTWDAYASLLLNMIESRFYVAEREGLGRLESIALLELPQPLPSEHTTSLAKLEKLGLGVVDDAGSERNIPPVVLWAANDELEKKKELKIKYQSHCNLNAVVASDIGA